MKFGLREIVFIVLLMVIPVGAWWFVYRPQNAANAEMRRQIEARQAKLRELNKITGTIGNLEKEIEALSGAVTYFQSKLPSEKEIDKILQEIWILAESNHLHAKSIRTLKRMGRRGFLAEGSDHAEQPIVVQLEGDFLGFYAFLTALESQPRIMRISKMKLKLLRKSLTGGINVEFEMSIFFERNPREKRWPQRNPT